MTYTSLTLPEKATDRDCCPDMRKPRGRQLTAEQKIARRKRQEWNALVKKAKIHLDWGMDKCVKGITPNPPPSRVYKIGEEINLHSFEWAAILKVYGEGKYYKVVYVNPVVAYGKYKGHELKLSYVPWYDILPKAASTRLNDEGDRLEQDDDIRFQYSQRHISSLLMTYYESHGGIDLEPDYQRGNVWSEKQKVSLIDSIFRNIDIGKFTIIKLPFTEDGPGYEMLDGKQRLIALTEFYESRYPYKGKYYHEMHWRDRIHFREYPISYAESVPLTKEQKYRYFLKLNTSGVPVDPDHLTNVMLMLEREQKNG